MLLLTKFNNKNNKNNNAALIDWLISTDTPLVWKLLRNLLCWLYCITLETSYETNLLSS